MKSISCEKTVRSVFIGQPSIGVCTPNLAVAYSRVEIENNHFFSQPFMFKQVMVKSASLNRTVVLENNK
jgi:hypothetical protein